MVTLLIGALVAGALEALIALAALGIGIASCAAVRLKGDYRRKGFRWVGSALLSLFLSAGSLATITGLNSYYFSNGVSSSLNRWFTTFYYTGSGFNRVTNALTLYVLFQTAVMNHPSRATRSRKVLGACNIGTCIVMVVLTLAAFGGKMATLKNFTTSNSRTYSYIAAAVDILFLLLSSVAFVLNAVTLHAIRMDRKGIMHDVDVRINGLILAAAIIYWIQTIWTMAESMRLNVTSAANLVDSHFLASNVGAAYLNFIALVILYAAARRSTYGLWSKTAPAANHWEHQAASMADPSHQQAQQYDYNRYSHIQGGPRADTKSPPAELRYAATSTTNTSELAANHQDQQYTGDSGTYFRGAHQQDSRFGQAELASSDPSYGAYDRYNPGGNTAQQLPVDGRSWPLPQHELTGSPPPQSEMYPGNQPPRWEMHGSHPQH